MIAIPIDLGLINDSHPNTGPNSKLTQGSPTNTNRCRANVTWRPTCWWCCCPQAHAAGQLLCKQGAGARYARSVSNPQLISWAGYGTAKFVMWNPKEPYQIKSAGWFKNIWCLNAFKGLLGKAPRENIFWWNQFHHPVHSQSKSQWYFDLC